jgi:hypothetical protein
MKICSKLQNTPKIYKIYKTIAVSCILYSIRLFKRLNWHYTDMKLFQLSISSHVHSNAYIFPKSSVPFNLFEVFEVKEKKLPFCSLPLLLLTVPNSIPYNIEQQETPIYNLIFHTTQIHVCAITEMQSKSSHQSQMFIVFIISHFNLGNPHQINIYYFNCSFLHSLYNPILTLIT